MTEPPRDPFHTSLGEPGLSDTRGRDQRGPAWPVDRRLVSHRWPAHNSGNRSASGARPWTLLDTEDALATYGVADVTGWLTPATDRIGDTAAMQAVLGAWADLRGNRPRRRAGLGIGVPGCSHNTAISVANGPYPQLGRQDAARLNPTPLRG